MRVILERSRTLSLSLELCWLTWSCKYNCANDVNFPCPPVALQASELRWLHNWSYMLVACQGPQKLQVLPSMPFHMSTGFWQASLTIQYSPLIHGISIHWSTYPLFEIIKDIKRKIPLEWGGGSYCKMKLSGRSAQSSHTMWPVTFLGYSITMGEWGP